MICLPENKEPLSLRISVTDRCQLRCLYCMPEEGAALCSHHDILSYEEIIRCVDGIRDAFDVRKIRLTGGDPLARRGITDLVRMLAERQIPDLALSTNAQQLATFAPGLKHAGLHRVNISLDSLNEATYASLTRGGDLKQALAGLAGAQQAGLSPIRLNMVVMKGINDTELEDMVLFALANDVELRFLELMPIGISAAFHDRHFLGIRDVRRLVQNVFPLEPLLREAGSTSQRYRLNDRGARATLGFIASFSEPFCNGCRRLRLTADARLVGCLTRGQPVPIRHYLDSGDTRGMMAAVEQAMAQKGPKPARGQKRLMVSVGG